MEAISITLPSAAAEATAGGALSDHQWTEVVSALGLSPQQARVVELILQNKSDKQIALEMGVRPPTVRTYLTRIFQRTGTTDRVGLLLRVFACARQPQQTGGQK